MAGVKRDDFVMVMGYPVRRRYRESYSIAYNQDIFMPLLISCAQMKRFRRRSRRAGLQIKLQSRIADILTH
jgi:hypothetical protein